MPGPPAIREALHAVGSGSGGLSVTTGAGTAVDDVLLTIQGSDYYDGANLVSPSGTAGVWTEVPGGYASLGVNNSHVKAWTRRVTVAGAQLVTVTPINDEDKF